METKHVTDFTSQQTRGQVLEKCSLNCPPTLHSLTKTHKRRSKTMLQATHSKTTCNIAHCPFAHTKSDRNTEREKEQQEKGDDSLHSLSGFKVFMHLQQLLSQHAQRLGISELINV